MPVTGAALATAVTEISSHHRALFVAERITRTVRAPAIEVMLPRPGM
jgi:hypothetical protein